MQSLRDVVWIVGLLCKVVWLPWYPRWLYGCHGILGGCIGSNHAVCLSSSLCDDQQVVVLEHNAVSSLF